MRCDATTVDVFTVDVSSQLFTLDVSSKSQLMRPQNCSQFVHPHMQLVTVYASSQLLTVYASSQLLTVYAMAFSQLLTGDVSPQLFTKGMSSQLYTGGEFYTTSMSYCTVLYVYFYCQWSCTSKKTTWYNYIRYTPSGTGLHIFLISYCLFSYLSGTHISFKSFT